MKRTNIYLSDRQEERLSKMAEETGLTKAELVRRAIDFFFKHESGDKG